MTCRLGGIPMDHSTSPGPAEGGGESSCGCVLGASMVGGDAEEVASVARRESGGVYRRPYSAARGLTSISRRRRSPRVSRVCAASPLHLSGWVSPAGRRLGPRARGLDRRGARHADRGSADLCAEGCAIPCWAARGSDSASGFTASRSCSDRWMQVTAEMSLRVADCGGTSHHLLTRIPLKVGARISEQARRASECSGWRICSPAPNASRTSLDYAPDRGDVCNRCALSYESPRAGRPSSRHWACPLGHASWSPITPTPIARTHSSSSRIAGAAWSSTSERAIRTPIASIPMCCCTRR